ncbi:MAG: hypothetical protein IPM82_30310 [Saprospiraceae bacterium]|nr:hypothetical protein [Saprospiraceae bacterium]
MLLTVANSANGCTETTSVVVDQDIAAPTAEAGSANLFPVSRAYGDA